MQDGNDFGRDRQYGTVGPGTLGAFASAVRDNPNCRPARGFASLIVAGISRYEA